MEYPLYTKDIDQVRAFFAQPQWSRWISIYTYEDILRHMTFHGMPLEIQDLFLLEKTGGKSGDFRREL